MYVCVARNPPRPEIPRVTRVPRLTKETSTVSTFDYLKSGSSSANLFYFFDRRSRKFVPALHRFPSFYKVTHDKKHIKMWSKHWMWHLFKLTISGFSNESSWILRANIVAVLRTFQLDHLWGRGRGTNVIQNRRNSHGREKLKIISLNALKLIKI